MAGAPRLVILDRDGVINRDSVEFIRAPEQWQPLPGSLPAIARLNRAGFRVIVATNQSGLARGLFTTRDLAAIHTRMREAVAASGGTLAGIFVCPHGPEDDCACRKPRPGLLRQIETELGVNLVGTPMIGDSARDLGAARAVGGRPILVRTGNGRETERALTGATDVVVYDDLASAAEALIAEDPGT
jgi:D-glycero-D-manno-heptose 1,7-bisphosphate phosphatase